MSFGSRLKERRNAMKITQEALGEILGVSGNAIGNYEKGISSPNADALYKLFDVLECDANYLFQDEMESNNEFSASEMETIRKYRTLDEYGRKAVDAVLAIENDRQFQTRGSKPVSTKVIPLLGNSFAAGIGEPDFGNVWEDYEVSIDNSAEFAVRINGNSMEPYLPDGSIAFGVKKPPEDGDVAALMLDGDFLCKQVCQDNAGNVYLFSLNRERKDADITIRHDSDRRLLGFGTIIMPRRLPLPQD